MQGNTMYVANVGDSRAVLAEVKAGKLVARDLTWDQTPFRQACFLAVNDVLDSSSQHQQMTHVE